MFDILVWNDLAQETEIRRKKCVKIAPKNYTKIKCTINSKIEISILSTLEISNIYVQNLLDLVIFKI